eukprot:362332-Chlamydomonas_euryale.AAC.1
MCRHGVMMKQLGRTAAGRGMQSCVRNMMEQLGPTAAGRGMQSCVRNKDGTRAVDENSIKWMTNPCHDG